MAGAAAQKTDAEQVLLEVPATSLVEDALLLCVETRNLCDRLAVLCSQTEKALQAPVALRVQSTTRAEETLLEAKNLVSKEHVKARQCISVELLRTAVTELTKAYGALRPPDAVESSADVAEASAFEGTSTELWFAGKKLRRETCLKDYIGSNDKTLMVVKLQQEGDIKPSREPAFDEDARKELMAWQFKREQQLKDLAADDVICGTSLWADTTALRQSLTGLGNVRIR